LNVDEDPQQPMHNVQKLIDSIHYDIWHESVLTSKNDNMPEK